MWRLALLLLTGCGLATPRTGEVLSPGVAEAVFEHRAFGTDLLHTRVVFPAKDDGSPRTGPFPAVVFIQGGLVPESRYRWWAEAMAREGYVVALPTHAFDLALFTTDTGSEARKLLVAPPASLLTGLVDANRIAVGGHSLGGVVAAKLVLQGGFAALLIQASLPDAADKTPLSHLKVPSMSLAGSNDCSAALAKVTEGAQSLASPTALVVLDGVTHYQFTDSDREDVARKCASGIDLETAHARIVAASKAFLEAAMSGAPNVGVDALGAVPGSTVSAR